MNEQIITSYGAETSGNVLGGFFLALGGLLFIVLAILFAIYVFRAIVYMKIGKKAGLSNTWISFLPLGEGIIAVSMRGWFWAIGLVPLLFSFVGYEALVSLLFLGWCIFVDSIVLEEFGENPMIAALHLIPGIGSLIVFIKIASLAFGPAEPVNYGY